MSNIKLTLKIKELAKIYNLPESVIEDMFNSQFKFYREIVSNLPLKTIQTEEEFNNLKTIFYFKYIGKFHTNWKYILKIRKQTLNKKNNE